MPSETWRQASEVWKAISKCIILVKLHWTGSSSEHYGHKKTLISVTVICVYASAAAAPPGLQSKFRYKLMMYDLWGDLMLSPKMIFWCCWEF